MTPSASEVLSAGGRRYFKRCWTRLQGSVRWEAECLVEVDILSPHRPPEFFWRALCFEVVFLAFFFPLFWGGHRIVLLASSLCSSLIYIYISPWSFGLSSSSSTDRLAFVSSLSRAR
ncbi:hypothetical protein EV426DRAFT_605837 [Tirmania nivea]|nr:hypothetical protein EV426DRAFT_605837 [Tirmania nivea]